MQSYDIFPLLLPLHPVGLVGPLQPEYLSGHSRQFSLNGSS